MKYVKIRAKNYVEALTRLRKNWGDKAIPISHSIIKAHRIPIISFKKYITVLTAAVPDECQFDPKKINDDENINLSKNDFLYFKEIERLYQKSQYTITLMQNLRDADRTTDVHDASKKALFLSIPYTISIEIGYSLIPLVDPEHEGTLVDTITTVRKYCSNQSGIPIPHISIRDNMDLEPTQYLIRIKGVEAGRGNIQPGKCALIGEQKSENNIAGEEFIEPAFGLKSLWIDSDAAFEAKRKGFSVFEVPIILKTHLTEIIKKSYTEILGVQEVSILLERIKLSHPGLYSCFTEIPKIYPLLILNVLRNLLREEVPIRDFVTILESLLLHSAQSTDPDILTEYVRSALSREICRRHVDSENRIHVITLDPTFEMMIRGMIVTNGKFDLMSFSGCKEKEKILSAAKTFYAKAVKGCDHPVFLVHPDIRQFFFRLIDGSIENVAVISGMEIFKEIQINIVELATI